ncbi:MAG: response regulator transcription factor [Proteobacteria bacterium]|nr:response regulator transcription factor [Pseudomonadota bacterium]
MNAAVERPVVYLVDADAASRLAYRRLLQPLGYHIEDFGDATAFLRALRRDAAGCLLLDFELPDLSGAQLHERLRASASPLAVVYASAAVNVPAAVAAMQRGASDVLVKPVREQQLLDAVNRALRRSAAEAVQSRARRAVLDQLARLTARERQVLEQLIEGVHYDGVSSALGITKRTVEAHRRRIMEKMGARTLPQLLQQLARADWPPRSATHAHADAPR